MRHVFAKILISVVSITVATSLASCGGADTPTATSPPADPNAAFEQYEDAAKPYECSKAYTEMFDAAKDKHFGIMKDKARQHRDVVAPWDDQLSRIAFPDAAQPIVAKMRDHIATELTGLNELVGIDDKDADRIWTLIDQVQADDSSAMVEGDHLRATLGHPVPQARYAADLLDSAYSTFYRETSGVSAKWTTAMAADDLAGAKAANKIEEDALQRYIDRLDTISWPPGTFEGQANTVREHLRGLIEYDRHQVDVASTAQIVPSPETGAPDYQAAEDAEGALWGALMRDSQRAEPSKC